MNKELGFDFGELRPEFIDDDRNSIVVNNLKTYSGPERRQQSRRSNNDRRAYLRFQPGKCIDRRDKPERRKSGKPGSYQ